MTNEAIQTKTTMRQLLARWAEVEPMKCKHESEINQLQPREREQLSISTPYGWQIVFTEAGYHPDEFRASMAIQMIVQRAIIARGWAFTLKFVVYPNNKYWQATVGDQLKKPAVVMADDASATEALLSAYLKALEANQ